MKRIHLIILAFSTVLSMFGCVGRKVDSQVVPADDRYTEAKAMSFHWTEPERALQMIDSAVLVGNVSRERGEFLKATTQYGGLNNLPLARQICVDLLENEAAQTDSVTLEQTCLLLAGIEYTMGNHPAIIRYATEASRLAHKLNKPDEVGKAEGLVAQSMAQTGRTDEGIGRLKETLDELRPLDSFKAVTAYHDVTKKLVRIYIDNLRFAEVAPACEASLERIGELGDHPERFGDMNAGFDPSEFVDFARGQTLAYMTIAYARMGDLPKARKAEEAVFRTKWSQSVDCDKLMSAAYHYMGEFERFDKAMRRFEHAYPDSINANYVICLEQRSAAARMQGRNAEALGYLQRAYGIRDSLDRRNQRDQLGELATLYHLQEEQLARQQKEAEAERAHIINVALAIGLLAALAFAFYFFYKRRETARKNRVLAREIAEAIVYKEKYEAQQRGVAKGAPAKEADNLSGLSDAELYQQLRAIILREQLYLDARLDRQMLVDRFGLTKERIGAAFSKGSPFQSLIEFLNDCRLPYAAKLLTGRPELSIADVARESGFPSADTFGRNFRQKYALTPSQFREQQR